jgi:Fe-S oxidoreductase
MAGLYGHEAASRATSETIYGLSWGPILADARHAGRTLATGYSCRCQASLIDGLQLMHPVQLLLRVVKGGAVAHSLHANTASVREREQEQEHHEEY